MTTRRFSLASFRRSTFSPFRFRNSSVPSIFPDRGPALAEGLPVVEHAQALLHLRRSQARHDEDEDEDVLHRSISRDDAKADVVGEDLRAIPHTERVAQIGAIEDVAAAAQDDETGLVFARGPLEGVAGQIEESPAGRREGSDGHQDPALLIGGLGIVDIAVGIGRGSRSARHALPFPFGRQSVLRARLTTEPARVGFGAGESDRHDGE